MNLMDKEGQWAYRLKSIKPQGLNNSDFFSSIRLGLTGNVNANLCIISSNSLSKLA